MPEYPLEFATRQVRRTFERAIGKSVVKILTELITNSDDSYRRLEQSENNLRARSTEPKPIFVILERSRKRISVIDNAEGLTDEEMKIRFVTYGEDSSDRLKGLRTRSLFGKGLRDVLFTQKNGQVKSIKGNHLYNCRFKWKDASGHERPTIDIRPPSRVTPEIREAFRIPETGTVVEFVLREDVPNPQPDKLLEELSKFYMLRMVNSSPYRDVLLLVIDRNGNIEQRQLNYQFPEWEIQDRFEDKIVTDIGNEIQINCEIGLCPEEMKQGEVGYVNRDGGLLVLDEDDAVLDLSLFGFDEDPAARRIAGIIRLVGAGDYIRAKLNQHEPEEILTETRDGFDKQNEFYRQLQLKIRPRLEPIVSKLRELGPTPPDHRTEKTRKRHQEALDILNQLASQMLGNQAPVPFIPINKLIPPPEGIAFLNSHISIRTGISTPTALLINTSVVSAGDTISIESSNPEITMKPTAFIVEGENEAPGVEMKIIRISSDIAGAAGFIRAKWKEVSTEIEVTCTSREVITPVNGLEFERDAYSVRINGRRYLRLFIDTETIPVGSEIVLNSERRVVEVAPLRAIIRESDLVTQKVALLEITARGKSLTRDVLISATFKQYTAGTKVSVVKREPPDKGRGGGLFKDYKFEPLERKIQTHYTQDGYIIINTKDPVNARYFGDDPHNAVETYTHCQVRLADLILNECLQVMVSRAYNDSRLDIRFPDNPEIDIRSYVDEKKFEIGPTIHAKIVTHV